MATYPELSGRVAVVTGAAGNLGSAVVRRLYQENVRLAVVDRNEQRLREATAGLERTTMISLLDLSAASKSEVDQVVEKISATFGQIDILVNTVGGYQPGKPVHEMDESHWDFMLQFNAKAAFLMSAAAARAMVAKGSAGRIINVAGRAGLSAFATGAAYSAGKAAVLRLTESMSAELVTKGITVNAVLPSTIDTPQNRKNEPDADFSKWVTPESLADVIAFLVSDSARDISGAAIPVYGRA